MKKILLLALVISSPIFAFSQTTKGTNFIESTATLDMRLNSVSSNYYNVGINYGKFVKNNLALLGGINYQNQKNGVYFNANAITIGTGAEKYLFIGDKLAFTAGGLLNYSRTHIENQYNSVDVGNGEINNYMLEGSGNKYGGVVLCSSPLVILKFVSIYLT